MFITAEHLFYIFTQEFSKHLNCHFTIILRPKPLLSKFRKVFPYFGNFVFWATRIMTANFYGFHLELNPAFTYFAKGSSDVEYF